MNFADLRRIAFVDSHTGGMPTRVITAGFPTLAGATVAERAKDLERFRRLRRAVVTEPRAGDATVAALLGPPDAPDSATSAIFFDQTDVLGMCGHGAIGLARTLHATGKIAIGGARFDTPAGPVAVECLPAAKVRFDNVPSRRLAKDVELQAQGIGRVRGDVAYGGNTFFLVNSPAVDLAQPLEALNAIAKAILRACAESGASAALAAVNHVELFGAPRRPEADARNYVLCPSGAHDRSPCGTGTSAKLACLAADGKLAEGEEWVQESITGSLFAARYRWLDRARGVVLPTLTGEAELVAAGDLLFQKAELLPDEGRQ